MGESVVVDDEGVTHYCIFRGVSRLEWRQVQEVSAEWIIQAFAPISYATLTGDAAELIIREGCEGFSSLLARLAAFPGFPSHTFVAALKSLRYDEKEVVWRLPVPPSSSEDLPTGQTA